MNTKIAERISTFLTEYLVDQVSDHFNTVTGIFYGSAVKDELVTALRKSGRRFEFFSQSEFMNISDLCGKIATGLINGETVIVQLEKFPEGTEFVNFLQLFREENEFHDSLTDRYQLSSKKPLSTGHLVLSVKLEESVPVGQSKFSAYCDDWLDIRKIK
jgi:hypothetical protein